MNDCTNCPVKTFLLAHDLLFVHIATVDIIDVWMVLNTLQIFLYLIYLFISCHTDFLKIYFALHNTVESP